MQIRGGHRDGKDSYLCYAYRPWFLQAANGTERFPRSQGDEETTRVEVRFRDQWKDRIVHLYEVNAI